MDEDHFRPPPEREPRDNIVINVAGYALRNGRPNATGGWAVSSTVRSYNSHGRLKTGPQTNNRCELEAISKALHPIYVMQGADDVVIRTDSQYILSTFEDWIFKWRENKWKNRKGKPVENADIIQEIVRLLRSICYFGSSVTIEEIDTLSPQMTSLKKIAKTAAAEI